MLDIQLPHLGLDAVALCSGFCLIPGQQHHVPHEADQPGLLLEVRKAILWQVSQTTNPVGNKPERSCELTLTTVLMVWILALISSAVNASRPFFLKARALALANGISRATDSGSSEKRSARVDAQGDQDHDV